MSVSYRAMLLRNQLERMWVEYEEEPESPTSLDFISPNEEPENRRSKRY